MRSRKYRSVKERKCTCELRRWREKCEMENVEEKTGELEWRRVVVGEERLEGLQDCKENTGYRHCHCLIYIIYKRLYRVLYK